VFYLFSSWLSVFSYQLFGYSVIQLFSYSVRLSASVESFDHSSPITAHFS